MDWSGGDSKSSAFKIPSWQTAVQASAGGVYGHAPDISAHANPSPGVSINSQGSLDRGPRVTGIRGLYNQQAAASDKADLGVTNPPPAHGEWHRLPRHHQRRQRHYSTATGWDSYNAATVAGKLLDRRPAAEPHERCTIPHLAPPQGHIVPAPAMRGGGEWDSNLCQRRISPALSPKDRTPIHPFPFGCIPLGPARSYSALLDREPLGIRHTAFLNPSKLCGNALALQRCFAPTAPPSCVMTWALTTVSIEGQAIGGPTHGMSVSQEVIASHPLPT
ncbi:hypothetical protein AB0L75_17995 [Streptomyces sp. NPDC052101]|uniref:hypothetical protein n=1 Tax=Streptomyces sp. NPDC052101 TaxID=3155763 RepID=UPI0034194A9F